MARKKFKFVEMFINPATGAPFEDTGSPKVGTPNHFPPFVGHQIARITYEEKEITDVQYTVGKDGKVTKGEEKKRKILVEKMGEKGGWIEQTSNLSQDGKCWVGSGGIVCGNGFVCDDVVISSGEVGQNAKVGGNATIGGAVGIGGNAYVYGNAKIGGSARIAVSGTARVEGKVEGSAVVDGSAYVGEKATIKGNAHVTGNSKVISGTVDGNAVVEDCATVYGTVKGDAKVSYEAIILKTGRVEGKAVVESGIIEGTVKGNVQINYGQAFIGDGGSVEDTTKLSGNVFVKCVVKNGAEMSANASAMDGGSVTGGKIEANGSVKGKSEQCIVGGTTVIVGNAGGDSTFADGCRVGESGNAGSGEYSGSANVGGSSQSPMSGNSVVAPEASSSISLSGTMVFQEEGDQEPEGVAVVCKVEA